jgi:hypothetical protein
MLCCHIRPTVPDLTIGTPASAIGARLRSRPMKKTVSPREASSVNVATGTAIPSTSASS